MISEKFKWEYQNTPMTTDLENYLKKEKLPLIVGQLLAKRGIETQKEIEQFFSLDLTKLHDPYLLNDMQKAVERIRQAIEDDEIILVYGDYDADGMTSASIMQETLEMLGANVITYLPNRFTDGYGPNTSVYKYYIEQHNVSLIVTVDNGVSGFETIEYANAQGVDVIITDHHSLPQVLPNAYAIIHPEHPEGNYPFSYLAGCGVAFKLACALLESVPNELLDLVAIGTIADMVSLTDENRLMVKVGLEVLKQTDRIGLQELLKISQISMEDLTEESIGFKLAPQLNALGRLDDPNPAIDLLTGFDDEQVVEIAAFINEKNEERKMLVDSIFQEALEMVDETKTAQVLAKKGWHAGVLGIVAGRLLETLNQPIVVLTVDGDLAKGSARSIDAVNIFEVLNQNRNLFTAFGGHSGAAGMTLPSENLSELSHIICSFISLNDIDMSQKKVLELDGQLHLSDLDLDLVKTISKLAPFGMDNPKPIFQLSDFKVVQAHTMGQSNKHLKAKLQEKDCHIDLVAFNQGSLVSEFQQANPLELAVTLSVNKWNGNTSLQLMLEDAKVSGIQLYDFRSKKLNLPGNIPNLSEKTKSGEVVLYDVPESPVDLIDLFKKSNFSAIYFKNHIRNEYYLTGSGTRDQYAKLYKTLYTYPEFDIRYKIKELAHFLKIPMVLLIKMIQIFEELGFVKITDGIMIVVKDAPKKEITSSKIFQDLEKTIKFQELMALGTPRDIYNYLMNNS